MRPHWQIQLLLRTVLLVFATTVVLLLGYLLGVERARQIGLEPHHAANRIAVLESDIATMQRDRSKSDELGAMIASSISLHSNSCTASAGATFAFNITSTLLANSLCRSPGVASVFLVDVVAGHLPVAPTHTSYRELRVGCPSKAHDDSFEASIQLPLNARSQPQPYTVSYCAACSLLGSRWNHACSQFSSRPAPCTGVRQARATQRASGRSGARVVVHSFQSRSISTMLWNLQ